MNLDVRFELLDKIGSGSYATVYRARDKELGREVAVKQIHQQFLDDPRTLDRYWAEAQLLASLHHPNIVTIFDIVRDRGWLIMELMQGSLKERLQGRQMDLRSLRASLAHCLRALKYLHDRGVLHGDIKPGNMMIDHRKRVKLGDFGLARRVSDDEGSLLKGTAKYIAPEVVSDEFGEVGPHSDLYALGFSAYELMCGSENFEDLFPGLSAFGRDKQAAWMMWHAAPDRKLPEISRVLDGVPADLAQVIQKLVEKDPARRYQRADDALSDLKVDLKIIKSGGDDEDGSVPPDAAPPEPPKGRRGLVIAAFAVRVVMSLAMLFIPGGTDRPAGPAQTSLGVVREVNLAAKQLEYEDPQTGRPALLDLPDSATILLLQIGTDQKYILPKDIAAGDWIEIERTGDGSAGGLELTVSRPASSTGVLRSVDAATRRVTVAVRSGAVRDDLVMEVPQRAQLSLNGRRTDLRQLAIDDSVDVRHVLDPAGKLGHIVSDLTARRIEEFSAFVDRVDLDAGELHLKFGRGSAEIRTLPFADDVAIVFKSGETLQKSDLREGDRLTVRADDQVRRITVTREDLQITGTVAAVDPARPSLTVNDAQGKKHTFTLQRDTDVTLGLQPAELAELRAEIDSVTVSYSEQPDGSLVAAAVDAHRGTLHDRWGLIIGCQAYGDRAVPRLPNANADAQLVYESLTNRYAMDSEWTLRLFDRTRNDVEREVERFLGGVGRQHQVVVYIAAHAFVSDEGVVYLAFTDFKLDDMAATGLPLDWLVKQLEQCPSTDKLLLLDIVHDVGTANAARQPSIPDMLYKLQAPIRQTDVIGSSSRDQRGLDLPGENHSAFARFLAAGYSGSADENKDLRITGGELFNFLERRFATATLPGGKQQTPFRLEQAAPDGPQ